MADLADCLNDISPISAGERAVLEALETEVRRFKRGMEIRPEGDPKNEIFVLKEGCVKSSMSLESTDRQIIRLHYPGDLLGSSGMGFAEAVEALHAANDVEVAVLDKTRFAKLFEVHPRLGLLIYMSAQSERVTLMNRLCSVGQTSARSRVAALLVTTCDRMQLQAPGQKGDVRIPFPFTQTEMGQMAGLSAVHVNRVVKSLVGEGLMNWRREIVIVRDFERLREIASVPRHPRDETLSWLPWPPHQPG